MTSADANGYAERVRRLLAGDFVDREALGRASDADLHLLAATGQLGSVWRDGQYSAPLEEVAEDFDAWERDVLEPLRPAAAFMDNTTLYSVQCVTMPGVRPTPVALSDLGTFVNAVVLRDRVLHLEHPVVKPELLNERFRDSPVHRLPVESFDLARRGKYVHPDTVDQKFPLHRVHGVGALLAMLFTHAHREADAMLRVAIADQAPDSPVAEDLRAQAQATRDAWAAVLGREISLQEIVDARELESGWSSPSTQLVDALLNQQAMPPTGPTAAFGHSVISETNRRAVFNERFATQVLRRPYEVGILRRPYRDFRLNRARAAAIELARDRAAEVLDEIEPRRGARLGEQQLQLPIFLAVCIERAETLDDFWTEVAEWRRRAAPLRAHIAELTATLAAGGEMPDKAAKRLRKALADDAAALAAASRTGAVVGAGLIELFTGALEAALGLSGVARVALPCLVAGGMATLDGDTLRRLVRHIRDPELVFLSDVGAAHRAIVRDHFREVKKLWRLSDSAVEELEASYARLAVLDVR